MQFAKTKILFGVPLIGKCSKRCYAFQYDKRSILTTEVLPPQFYALLAVPFVGYYFSYREYKNWNNRVKVVESMKQRMNQPPVPLPKTLSDLKEMEFTPVKLIGEFDHDNEFVIQPKQRVDEAYQQSLKGYFDDFNVPLGGLVITPFKLADRNDAKVLVSRGWVPQDKIKKETRESGQIKGQIEIVGVTRNQEKKPSFAKESEPAKNQYSYRDIHAMAWTHKTLPYYFEAIKNDGSSAEEPIGGQTSLFTSKAYYFKMFGWLIFATTTLAMWCLRVQRVRRVNFRSVKTFK